MKPARIEKPAIELIEEAVHALRQAPVSTLAIYYIGSLPFVIGLLYFWAEMSRSPLAPDHLAGESLGLALLFLWMKLWQARFAQALWTQIAGRSPAAAGFRKWRNLLTSQSALQVSGLFILPLALVLTIPFGWVYAFYQSLTVSAQADKPGLRDAFSMALRHAMLWPRQNHRLLLILIGFGAFVFLDWIVVCVSVPSLAKTFFGIETIFTRSPLAVFNSTFFAAMIALTYLSVDPLIKAVYTLRSFYGAGRSSGADIKAELKQFTPDRGALVAAAMVMVFLCVGYSHAALVCPDGTFGNNPTFQGWVMNYRTISPEGTADTVSSYFHSSLPDERTAPTAPANNSVASDRGRAANAGPSALPSRTESVSPPELDKKIGETLKESKYTWRFPRDTTKQPTNAEKGILGRFLERIGKWMESVRDWIAEMLRKLFNRRSASRSGSGSNWIVFLHLLLYLLIAAVIIAVGILIYSLVRKRGQKPAVIASVPIQPAPDLADENVGAEQLPEDGWTALGRELLAKGELRLALRAFYLASLAHLAARNLINLARFKSNCDYQRELQRRAHSFPQVLAIFGENVAVFDRIWYGMHETTPDLVNQFLAKVEMLKTGSPA